MIFVHYSFTLAMIVMMFLMLGCGLVDAAGKLILFFIIVFQFVLPIIDDYYDPEEFGHDIRITPRGIHVKKTTPGPDGPRRHTWRH